MNLNFWSPKPIPAQLPPQMTSALEQVKTAGTQHRAVEVAYEIVTKRFRGQRFATYLRLPDLFRDDLASIWNRPGFQHCTNLNYAMAALLVGSGRFKAADVSWRWTHIYGLAPHQVIRIQTDTGSIDADPWSARYGIKLGDYAHGLHAGRPW